MEHHTLDAKDMRALREADSVCFTQTPKFSGISAIRRVKDSPWNEEKTYSIPMAASDSDRYAAFGYVGSAKYHETWQTIVHLLRTGDAVRLLWGKDDGTNNYCKVARWDGDYETPGFDGLHVDMCYLEVLRGKDGKKRLLFLIDSSVTPDNSSRMVRKTF